MAKHLTRQISIIKIIKIFVTTLGKLTKTLVGNAIPSMMPSLGTC